MQKAIKIGVKLSELVLKVTDRNRNLATHVTYFCLYDPDLLVDWEILMFSLPAV